MVKEKGAKFIEGALILSSAGLIAKVMGLVYRIVLPRVLGEYGIGLFQLVYPIYTVLLVVSRSGIPVSLAKMVSDRIARKERKSAFKIFKVGRNLSIAIGLFFSLLMVLLANSLIHIFGWNSDVFYSIIAISPAIFFVSIMATYRGFFQGLQDMVPTAWSQIIEQFVRMITMIGLVYLLIPYGVKFAAAGATFGAVTGSIAGLLTIFFIYYKRREKIWKYVNTGSTGEFKALKIIKEMASLGIPVTLGALVLPLMSFVDAAIIPARLVIAGFPNPMELYGQMTGMAMVLVNFPTIITISLAASLVPAISEAFARQNHKLIKSRTETALRLTILISLPAAVGLYVLAEQLTTIIFGSTGAAVPLQIVSWGVLFIALQQTTSAILQGVGKTVIPARNLFYGALTNAVLNYFLTALPRFGIRGAALGTVTGFAVAAFLNIYYVKKYSDFNLNFSFFVFRPLIAVIIMSVVVLQGYALFYSILPFLEKTNYILSTFFIVPFGAVVYFFLLLYLREIKYDDLLLIPKIGYRLAEMLKRMGLVGENK
ncbi:MAG: putative polysaccharide biosynthesis protein [Halanaerobiaceae bacterium]